MDTDCNNMVVDNMVLDTDYNNMVVDNMVVDNMLDYSDKLAADYSDNMIV